MVLPAGGVIMIVIDSDRHGGPALFASLRTAERAVPGLETHELAIREGLVFDFSGPVGIVWEPTHEVVRKDGRVEPVRVLDGLGYTWREWAEYATASYELENGEWTFRGAPFAGKVLRVEGRGDRRPGPPRIGDEEIAGRLSGILAPIWHDDSPPVRALLSLFRDAGRFALARTLADLIEEWEDGETGGPGEEETP